MEVQYWQVRYVNNESTEVWTVVKAPTEMTETEIRDRLWNDPDVVAVTECIYTSNEDYTYDFT